MFKYITPVFNHLIVEQCLVLVILFITWLPIDLCTKLSGMYLSVKLHSYYVVKDKNLLKTVLKLIKQQPVAINRGGGGCKKSDVILATFTPLTS